MDNSGELLFIRKMSMSIAFLSLNKKRHIMLICVLNAEKTANLKTKNPKKQNRFSSMKIVLKCLM